MICESRSESRRESKRESRRESRRESTLSELLVKSFDGSIDSCSDLVSVSCRNFLFKINKKPQIQRSPLAMEHVIVLLKNITPT